MTMGYRSVGLKAVSAVAAGAAAVAAPVAVVAQERPADLTVLPPVPTDYTPAKLPWGDYDFTGTWPIENMPATRILFQRPDGYGDRVWITDEEHAKRVENAERSDGSYSAEGQGLNAGGTQGLTDWVKTSDFAWRTSMLVSPKDGKLPPLTKQGEALYKAGRSDWIPKQEFDWVDDMDSWDRCVTRGFPASMFPFRYNWGIRVFQSPGYITIMLEMLGTRVIPIGDTPAWPGEVESWLGDSRAHWEGKTLVIETSNIKAGDSATPLVQNRASSPVNMATQNVPPFNTIPQSARAHTTERLTMTGPDTILYEVTYDDPEVFTAPWTAQLEWARNDEYVFYEYACHEGNVMVRNYINASQAKRRQIASGEADPTAADGRETFARQFDFDPVAPGAPQFGPPPAPPSDDEDDEAGD